MRQSAGKLCAQMPWHTVRWGICAVIVVGLAGAGAEGAIWSPAEFTFDGNALPGWFGHIPAGVADDTSAILQASCPLLYTFDGSGGYEYVGISVGGVGDLNGDGCDDVFIGTVGYVVPNTQHRGRLCVHSGATGEALRCWFGQGGAYASAAAGAGDVDGDGVPDVIVGADVYSGPVTRSGRVYVYSGATGETIWTWDGSYRNGRFGESVAGPGDLDGDGVPDLLVGEPGLNSHLQTVPGQVHAFSGRTGELLWTHVGDYVNDRFGVSVSGAGDFNGDGILDVVAGAPNGLDWRAYVKVLSGVTGELLTHVDSEALWVIDVFGRSVAGLGDINGDGYDDMVVGAHEAGGEYPGNGYGQAYVFRGPDATRLYTLEAERSFFGYSVAGPGDVNGDGVPDVLVGGYAYSGYPGYMSGKAYVFSGATGEVLFARTGNASPGSFGTSVAGAGDVDGDGLMDIVVGAPTWANGSASHAGRAQVFRQLLPGNHDCDSAVTLGDFMAFSECWSGPGIGPASETCRAVDVDGNWVVDLKDFAAYARAMSIPPAP